MSTDFQRGCPNIGRCSLQVRGKGLARLQYNTLLRSPASSKVRRLVYARSSSNGRPTVALCVNHSLGLNDSNPEMLRLRQLALTSAQFGDYDKAIATFDRLLEVCPQSAVDYNNRGLVHFQAGYLDQALADYNQALELNPCLDSAYNNRANYYASKGNFLEAILDYDVALELNPDNVRALINQGITFRDLRMYNRALENFNVALKFHRLEGHIYTERGRTHHLSGDWNWAIADYKHAIHLLSTEPQAASGHLARLQHQIGRWMDELLSNLEPQESADA